MLLAATFVLQATWAGQEASSSSPSPSGCHGELLLLLLLLI
jgi:hypothetical protein